MFDDCSNSAGKKSNKHRNALKRSSGLAMYILYCLVTCNKEGLQHQVSAADICVYTYVELYTGSVGGGCLLILI